MILKNIFCIFLLSLFSSAAFSQIPVTRNFFDYNEKKIQQSSASYYVETYKENDADSYWQRKMYYNDTVYGTVASVGKSRDLNGEIKEGPFIYYYKNGAKETEGTYANNLKEGEWNKWDKAGRLTAVNNFRNGKMVGRNISWHSNGTINDSTILDESGNGKSFDYYENGGKYGEGNYTSGSKNGLWLYYYSSVKDQKSIEVIYEMDSAKSYTCFTETGEVQKKDCFFEREATFKGGDEKWKRYLIKKLTDKSDVYTKYLKSNQLYTAIVKFIVNKEGDLVDISVENPRNKELDKLAVEIVTDSPQWIPAVQYNRKVNAYRRQPISFLVSE